MKKNLWPHILTEIITTSEEFFYLGTIGAVCLLLSTILGSKFWLIGLTLSAACFGVLAVSLFTNYDNIVLRVKNKIRSQEKQKRNKKLDDLRIALRLTRGAYDDLALKDLRDLYDSFCDDLHRENISPDVPERVIECIHELFEACIKKLEQSVHLFELSKTMKGKTKKEVLAKRRSFVDQVELAIEDLSYAIAEIKVLHSGNDDLERLRNRLNFRLQSARELDKSAMLEDNFDRFREYE